LQNYVDKKGEINTDDATYAELSTMASDPARQREFAKINLLDYRDKLDDSDWRTVQSWQRSVAGALAGDAAAETKATKEATINQQIGTALDEAGIVGTGDTVKQRRGAFTKRARSALDEAERAKGSALSIDEVDKVIGRLLLQGEVRSGSMWANDREGVRAFEVLGTEDEARFAVPFSEIPEAERTKIGEKLKARGKPATEAEIERIYTRARMYAK